MIQVCCAAGRRAGEEQAAEGPAYAICSLNIILAERRQANIRWQKYNQAYLIPLLPLHELHELAEHSGVVVGNLIAGFGEVS